MVNDSAVIPSDQKAQITATLEDDAEVMSNTQLDELITGEPPEVEAEVLRINAEARDRSLQFALVVQICAALAGIGISLRMLRLPDVEPSADLGGFDVG